MSSVFYIAVVACDLLLTQSLVARPDVTVPSRASPQDHAPEAALRRVHAAASAGQSADTIAIDLPTIRSYIDKINDTCDKVEEVLDMTNATMFKLLDEMQPAVDRALSMLDKAKIASEAADTFGVSGMGSFVTEFAGKMSAKVLDFQAKLVDAGAAMQHELEEVSGKFADIKVNVLDKFGSAFGAVSSLVDAVVGIVEATEVAVEVAGQEEGQAGMMRRTAASGLPYGEASIKKSDLAAAQSMLKRGEVGSRATSAMKYGLSAKTLEEAKAAIEGARIVLTPLAEAIVELETKLQTGMLGQVLEMVETGVDELNQTAFDAVETATSSLPGVIKAQMQGMFDGVLSTVSQTGEQVEDQIAKILSKLEEAKGTKAELGEAVTMMDDVVDGVSPIFEGSESFAARFASSGCALFLAAGLTFGSTPDF